MNFDKNFNTLCLRQELMEQYHCKQLNFAYILNEFYEIFNKKPAYHVKRRFAIFSDSRTVKKTAGFPRTGNLSV
jgi:hypothetical protein